MSTRREDPESWRTEAQAASASGGHLPPDVQTSDPLLDALTAPLPSERDAPVARETERREVIPHAARDDDAFVAPRRPAGRRMRPAVRRVKRTLKHVDPLSVLKLSLFFYACFLVVWLVVVAVVYSVLSSIGLFDAIEKFGRGLVLWDEVNITIGFVEKWAFLIGLTFMVIASLINVVLAALYNIASNLIGGAELTFTDREL